MSVLFLLAAAAEALEFTFKKGKIMREREREKDDIQVEECDIFFDLLSVNLLTSVLIGLRSALCVFPHGYA